MNIGAHIGTFDIAAASLVKEIPFACSVEMNPRTFTRLNFNLHLNGLAQVTTINAGAGGKNGTAGVRPTGCSLADNLFANGATAMDGKDDFTVPVLTLATVLEQAGMADREFDLLKVDCEGAEYSIIAESSPSLMRRFANIVMELHPEPAGESADALYRKLADCGFRTDQPPCVPSQEPGIRFWHRA